MAQSPSWKETRVPWELGTNLGPAAGTGIFPGTGIFSRHWDFFQAAPPRPQCPALLPPPGKPGQLRDPLARLPRPPVLFPRVPYVGGGSRGLPALPSASPCSFHPSAPSPPQGGHLGELTGRIPARSMGKKTILGRGKGVKSFRNAPRSPRCSISPFILPFATLTSCHVNHTANWQAGSS